MLDALRLYNSRTVFLRLAVNSSALSLIGDADFTISARSAARLVNRLLSLDVKKPDFLEIEGIGNKTGTLSIMPGSQLWVRMVEISRTQTLRGADSDFTTPIVSQLKGHCHPSPYVSMKYSSGSHTVNGRCLYRLTSPVYLPSPPDRQHV